MPAGWKSAPWSGTLTSSLPQVGPGWSCWGFALPSASRRNAAPRNGENPSEGEQWGFLLCGEFHQVKNRSPFLLRNGNTGFFESSFVSSVCCITLLSNLASIRDLSSVSECRPQTLWPMRSCHLFLSKMAVDGNKGLLFLRTMAVEESCKVDSRITTQTNLAELVLFKS